VIGVAGGQGPSAVAAPVPNVRTNAWANYVPTHRVCVACDCATAGDECWYCGADLSNARLVFVTGFRGETLDEMGIE